VTQKVTGAIAFMAAGEQIKFGPVDVAIVGSGLGGAAFARRLASRAPRLRILCIERGDWLDRTKLPAQQADWQRLALGPWASSPKIRLKAGGNAASAD
jgi:choline dehydrogenase-like flavoprotein